MIASETLVLTFLSVLSPTPVLQMVGDVLLEH